MSTGTFDFSSLTTSRTFTLPDATGTLALTTGSTSIITVGTITTGTWHGTKIGLLYGGTNADLSATGGASQVLQQATSGAAITVGQLALADLSDAATVALLAGPHLTGVPTAPTAAVETKTTQLATTAFVFTNAPLAVVSDPSPITPTAGASVSLTAYGAAAVWPIQPAGTLATLTVDIAAGSATDGGNLVFIAFTQVITAITWGSHISATHGLPLPVAITANQTVGFVWIAGDSKWTRFL